MHLDAAYPLVPIVSLAAGVFLLIAPRIVSFAVAVYLIIAGLLGLNGIYHFFKWCGVRGTEAVPEPRNYPRRPIRVVCITPRERSHSVQI